MYYFHQLLYFFYYICLAHAIGMSPKTIGDREKDKPNENTDDETVMIYQEFLLDPESKVEEVLDQGNVEVNISILYMQKKAKRILNNIIQLFITGFYLTVFLFKVLDFVRYECGESDADVEESSAARAQA